MPTTPTVGGWTDDQDRVGRFYDETASRVYGIVVELVRDPAEAERLTEEVYLTFCREHATDSSGLSASRLLAHAHVMVTDRLRGEAGRDCSRACRAVSPRERGGAPVEASALQRRAVEMAYFCGHSRDEVARLLGVPVASAADLIRSGLLGVGQPPEGDGTV